MRKMIYENLLTAVKKHQQPLSKVFKSLQKIFPDVSFSEMFVEGTGNSPTTGSMAIGVPGEMACLAHAHEKYGHLAWEILINEIADFTENGVFVTSTNEGALQKSLI